LVVSTIAENIIYDPAKCLPKDAVFIAEPLVIVKTGNYPIANVQQDG